MRMFNAAPIYARFIRARISLTVCIVLVVVASTPTTELLFCVSLSLYLSHFFQISLTVLVGSVVFASKLAVNLTSQGSESPMILPSARNTNSPVHSDSSHNLAPYPFSRPHQIHSNGSLEALSGAGSTRKISIDSSKSKAPRKFIPSRQKTRVVTFAVPIFHFPSNGSRGRLILAD